MHASFSGSTWKKKSFKLTFLLTAFFFYSNSKAQILINIKHKDFPITTSLEEFCKAEPQVLEQFFAEINLEYPGLEDVKQAVKTKNWEKASKSLITYYKVKDKNEWLIKSEEVLDANTSKVADDALADKFTFQGVAGSVKRLANERIDWYYNGPKLDIEWAFFLNRNFFLNDLANAYLKTEESRYAERCNNLLFDWIVSNPAYSKYTENQTWRPLEVGIRVGRSWVKTFYHLQKASEFTDITRLLMLISLYDHADYLDKYHGKHHNHAVSELLSLSKMALNFPEFSKSDSWYQNSIKNMQEEFVYSAYPDGAIKELTSHYHQVVTREFKEFILLNNHFGKQLEPFFNQVLESLYNYTAYSARPDGIGLNNNDSDLNNNFEILKEINAYFIRQDWNYIISNGKIGKMPPQTSVVFPWAGHSIMRNGYGKPPKKAHYSYFDIGPWGTTHQHNDKLHFSLYAGREFLCDNGRMYYKPDSIRSYFNLSIGHNVITLDDKGQNETAPQNKKPIDSTTYSIQSQADFSISTYEDGFGDKSRNAKSYSLNKSDENISGKHTRAVIYLKNRYWIVVDRIESDKPRKLTAYWHFNPSCEVRAEGDIVTTMDADMPNLKIFPVSESGWNVSLVKGQYSPYVQGWYSDVYNNAIPAYCAEYRVSATKNVETFAWIMFPSENNIFPSLTTSILSSSPDAFRFKIKIPGEETTEIAINMDESKPIKLSDKSIFTGKCAIIQKGKNPILIYGSVTNKNGKEIVKKK